MHWLQLLIIIIGVVALYYKDNGTQNTDLAVMKVHIVDINYKLNDVKTEIKEKFIVATEEREKLEKRIDYINGELLQIKFRQSNLLFK